MLAADALVHHAGYAQQARRRTRGGAHALWQMAERGAVTLPHVDVDLHGVLLETHFVVAHGVELFVAWRRDELHEDTVLGAIPSLDALEAVASLTVVRAVAGDCLSMPAGTVHMVVTERRKCHLAYHTYEA